MVNGLLGGAGLGGAAGLIMHQVQKLGGSGNGDVVQGAKREAENVKSEAKGLLNKAEDKAKEVKGEVQKRL